MLEVRNVSKRFGATVALDDVSLTVGEGEVVGFLGPNGSGKTTTMRSVMGLISVDAGDVRWKGRPITAEVRHRFGYMPAERGMYPKMRVHEQLVYFARLAGRTVADASAAADHWLERLGLTDRAGDEVQALSSGNQQRVQLAIALGARSRAAHPRRTVLRARPDRRRDDEAAAPRTGRPRRRGPVQQPPTRPRDRHLPRRGDRRPRAHRAGRRRARTARPVAVPRRGGPLRIERRARDSCGCRRRRRSTMSSRELADTRPRRWPDRRPELRSTGALRGVPPCRRPDAGRDRT